jgi:PTS system nitrogen regulatory IIA component
VNLKIKDIVELLQVSEKTIYRWIKDRKIPAYQINHQYRFNKAEINEWILKNKIDVSHKILDFNLTNRPVSILQLLTKGGVFYQIEGKDVPSIIRNAVKAIPVPPEITRRTIVSSLIEREEMMPTAVGKGIAIPHPRNPILADVENESVSICFLKEKIDYRAIDGEWVQTLFIVLSANSRRHLEILAKISYLCQLEEFYFLLKKQVGKEEILRFIRDKEEEWNKK